MAVVARTDMHGEILDGGYIVDTECLPPDFPYHLSRWEYDDRGIAVPKTSGSVRCKVFVLADEIPVAHAVFAADAAVVRCDNILVDRDHRRRGIADQLYQLAACLFDAPVVPSGRLLDDGERFWAGRTSVVCPP